MQQTLLALLGLLVVTTLNFSNQRASMQRQHAAIEREYRQLALGVAKQSVEAVRNRPYFDQAVRTEDDPGVSSFTSESSSQWGGDDCIRQGEIVSAPDGGNKCTAIEDFHSDRTQKMENPDGTIPVRIPGKTVPFQIEMEVHYVKQSGGDLVRIGPGEQPTRLKEVTVRVQDCQDKDGSDSVPCDGTSVLRSPVVFSEVIGYSR
ncbi:hypothetical protein [Salinibacter ruber]|uniref:hypothetical protein n=1 Tax=Salinibacter ruber TaxID=146919 RepID=UPI002072DBE1|nr:hypothetical protein [Salinibacter ruber]MCS3632074.1 hypothetical protein [Salinibacter ruber]MCS4051404.1 hypothetical protein [Salinibacter ruber]